MTKRLRDAIEEQREALANGWYSVSWNQLPELLAAFDEAMTPEPLKTSPLTAEEIAMLDDIGKEVDK